MVIQSTGVDYWNVQYCSLIFCSDIEDDVVVTQLYIGGGLCIRIVRYSGEEIDRPAGGVVGLYSTMVNANRKWHHIVYRTPEYVSV